MVVTITTSHRRSILTQLLFEHAYISILFIDEWNSFPLERSDFWAALSRI
jgi:hypothetical protein